MHVTLTFLYFLHTIPPQIQVYKLTRPDQIFFYETLFFQLSDRQCRSKNVLASLLEDLFMGHEIIPDVLDKPPKYPLEVTYKTIRTFPGMKLTADLTRFKPMLHWPANPNSIYTVVMSNLDINNRKNRYVQCSECKKTLFENNLIII